MSFFYDQPKHLEWSIRVGVECAFTCCLQESTLNSFGSVEIWWKVDYFGRFGCIFNHHVFNLCTAVIPLPRPLRFSVLVNLQLHSEPPGV